MSVAEARTYSGAREARKSRQTGAVVVLVDTWQEPRWLDSDGGRWATLCDTHGFVVNHLDRATARSFLADPVTWCDECRDKKRLDSNPEP